MKKKVIAAIKQHNMLKSGDSVCVALSGGADSVSLLHVLCSLKDEYKLNISAAHLNHNLRGNESDADEAFVRNLCERLLIPLVVKSVDVSAIAKMSGDSIELAARKARYEFFATFTGCKIATAHTASDNVETVLLNMTRGTAIKGLCGIPHTRENFVRPLIFCTRADIEKYCDINNLKYVTDNTNLTDDYTRNKLRHNAVPVLKDINPSVEAAVTRMCEALTVDNDFIERAATEAFELGYNDDTLLLEKGVHKAVAVRLINRFVFEKTGRYPDNLHLSEIYEALGEYRRIELFSGYYVSVNNLSLRIVNSLSVKNSSYRVITEIISKEKFDSFKKINKLLLKKAVDYDKICGELSLRTRVEGDSIKLLGRNVTKTLRKLYNENKILPEIRDILPVACDELGVIWVCGCGISERVCVDETTKNVLVFDYEFQTKL